MKRLILAGALALACTSAYANPNHGGQAGNCGNGVGSGNACLGAGGQGGAGGAANQGQGQQQGQGQGQQQGQGQGQGQTATGGAAHQSQSVHNAGNNVGTATASSTGGAGGSATGGSANATGGASSVGNVSTGAATASTGDSTASTNNSGNSTLVYTEANGPRPAVNTAYAAPSAIGGGVCAYTPASIGVMARAFGFSGQGAKIDKGCERRANADVLARMGYGRLACELLLNNREVRDTAERIHFACAEPAPTAISAALPPPAAVMPPVPDAAPTPAPPQILGERG